MKREIKKMKNTTPIFLFITCVGLGAALYYSHSSDVFNADIPVATNTEHKAAENIRINKINSLLEKRILELEKENHSLRKQLTKSGINNINRLVATDELVGERDPENYDATLIRENTLATTKLMAYVNSFQKQNPAAINNDLRTKFEAEPVDYAWAGGHEARLDRLFDDDKELSEFVPEKINCKSTKCRVTIPISSYHEANQAMKTITAALATNSNEFKGAMVMAIPTPSTGFVDFYIARSNDRVLH